jgi:multicomponent Na+:H+ antiporter subunit D
LDILAPLIVGLPLVCAAALTAFGTMLKRVVVDTFSLVVAVLIVALAALLLMHVGGTGRLVYWFGGWVPTGGVALGIDLAVDPIGAGLAALSALLVSAAFLYSLRYFETTGALFHSLMLVFLAATAGFVLSGDLFNMFVLFELMSVTAYALTGYKVERAGALQGAVNFAVTNSVGGVLILCGIGLVYGRTGALNLAQIGQTLQGSQPDGLVIVAFTLMATGFFVKAAMVPFHFWLPDAYTVAPTPVVILFSGIMSELGLYAVARIYWSAFQPVLAPGANGLRMVLLVLGAATAVVGAAMAFEQRHLKRLLAFVTLGHAGLFLMGVALLESTGLAGTSVYVVTDGLVKAGLFLCVGVLLHRCETVDEERLQGAGRRMPAIGAAFLLGGLALAGLPPLGPFFGKALVEEAAAKLGFHWVEAVFVTVGAITAAAVLRVWARVFVGLGEPIDLQARAGEEGAGEEEQGETAEEHGRTPAVMGIPLFLLMAAGLALGGLPGVTDAAARAAAGFVDTASYAAAVLHGAGHEASARAAPPTWTAVTYGVASTVAAAGIAAASLFNRRLPGALQAAWKSAVHAPVAALRHAHSGHVGDYVAWLTVGTALLGAAFAGVLGI